MRAEQKRKTEEASLEKASAADGPESEEPAAVKAQEQPESEGASDETAEDKVPAETPDAGAEASQEES